MEGHLQGLLVHPGADVLGTSDSVGGGFVSIVLLLMDCCCFISDTNGDMF